MTTAEAFDSAAPVAHGQTLEVTDLVVTYGDAIAVHRVSVRVEPGQVLALLGANGAGKSSTLNAISGVVPTTSGTISVGGVDLRGMPPQLRARYAAHVPEGRQLFPQHTVRENLQLAAFGKSRAEQAERLADAERVLPRLAMLRDRCAGLLSGGEQQMVALGRGLVSRAPVLMIDELSLGLAPTIAQQFAETLLTLKEEGYAILLVEQYVNLALEVADQVVLLDHGNVRLEGTADDVRHDVIALEHAYLGGGEQLEELDEEELLVVAAPKIPRARPVLGVVGALIVVGSMFLPWFKIGSFVAPPREISAWDLAAGWFWTPVLASTLVAAASVWRMFRRRPLDLLPAAAATAAGFVAFVAVFARCWLFNKGLPVGSIYQRRWGLLVAFQVAPLMIVGGFGLLRESVAARRASS